ncbi:UDP-glucose 4-epimerase GalE [Acuticoccus sp. M5D2P5]|uniref:UDP-glucose 4-epimerase GalE n=1 Tax=Acuticoccus kalidii TaxID=2910977 RepID=UPI001F2570EE|nr:UDP-glucose 4-epimerase GalE [Acuticoccus kalidii]MCF3935163.1 UDP-glucose 4-epimerase GalE [Acuticoccus kalidii]
MSNFILVTGGAGYVGSHTCKRLAARGFRPVTYDNLGQGHARAVRWGPLEVGDVCDTKRLIEVMHRYQPAAIVHFAASSLVGESVANPVKYYRANVGGTISLIFAALQANVDRLVFSSTCAVYGTPERLPITESEAKAPVSPYGRSKLMMETILRDCCTSYGLDVVALRYFNAAGADADGEIGEAHDPETHLVPLVLGAALDPARHITVFGTDYDTPDGTCIRDYIHVEDLAAAHVAAVERLISGDLNGFRTFNLGSGTGISVREIIDFVQAMTGRAINVREGPRREGDPPILVADPSRAETALDWRAERSDLQTIIGSAWAWMKRTAPQSSGDPDPDPADRVQPRTAVGEH